MPRYLCSSCDAVVEMAGTGRFDWCSSCGAPLTAEDRLPVRVVAKKIEPDTQASGGSAGDADLAAPALATTTNPIASASPAPSPSPSTT
jgi:hypothetical protein